MAPKLNKQRKTDSFILPMDISCVQQQNLRKMKTLLSLKYHAVHFLVGYLCLSALMSLTLGSTDAVSDANCEDQDANLIWRNTPTYSLSDVKAMAWYKGKGSLIATWVEGKGFVVYPPYIGRLLQINQTGIKIRTANRADSGTYWLSLTLASIDHKLETETHLEVNVAPSSRCKPRITTEESFVKADLPSEGCGTPRLTPKWKHTNRTIMQELQNSSSLLDLRRNPEPGEYIACAEGESARCYQENISDLCSRHTITDGVQHPHSDHGSTPSVETIAVVIPLIIAVVVAVVGVVRCRHRISSRKLCRNVEDMTEKEEVSWKKQINAMDFGKHLEEIKNRLSQLYSSMMTVPLSPTGENDHINISEMYVNIDFRKVEFTDLDNGERNTFSDSPQECKPLIDKDEEEEKQSNKSSYIFVFGACGSGKSTWCKHVVQCWLQKSDNNDANIKDLNLPDLRNIQILLYLPLQFSDRGLSFQELLTKHLFKENTTDLDFLMKNANSPHLLIVMDGLDIVKENVKLLSEIWHHTRMSLCTVIVTCRPANLKLLQETCNDRIEQLKLFRVTEMTPGDSKAYTRRILESIKRMHGRNLEFENFWRFTEHLQVQSLLKAPYVCLLMLHVWMETKNVSIEITDILLDLINNYLCRAMKDHHRNELIEKVFTKKSMNVNECITKLNQWQTLMKNTYLLHVLSGVAAEIYSSETERKTSKLKVPEKLLIPDEEGLELQVICETGLLTQSLSLSTNKKVTDLSFFDRIICELFVSIFIALREGNKCDFITSGGNDFFENGMILHMLVQLSPRAGKDIMVKARRSIEHDGRNNMGNEGRNHLKENFRYSVAQKQLVDETPVLWLQSLLYNDTLHENKLLFLTAALRYADKLSSLQLKNHENKDKLVFWLPVLPTLETLTLDISNCTLMLCKEWYVKVPLRLKEVVIQSVHINTCTLELFTRALDSCANIEMLEISPAEDCTDNSDILSEKVSTTTFSWMQLSERIMKCNTMIALKLSNLTLFGEVDTLLSSLKYCNNVTTLFLSNLSKRFQQTSDLSHSPATATGNDNDDKSLHKISLRKLDLEEIDFLHSPINFMFYTTMKGETNMVKNNLEELCMSRVSMSDESWITIGNQISVLTLSKLRLENVSPRGSIQILLDDIGKCKDVEELSLINIDTGEITPYFCFLKNMKKLSSLHLEGMNFAGPSSRTLFKGIGECKKLKTLFFGNIDIEEVPENLCFDLKDLSEFTVCKVRVCERSGSLSRLLGALRKCKNLKTLSLTSVNEADIPSELFARKTLTITKK